MKYISTRGQSPALNFSQILLGGLAPDGGLYLPESYPQLDDAALTRLRGVWQSQGYAALAFEVLSLYIDDIPADDLRALCAKTYTEQVFGTKEIVPLRQLEDGLLIEALSNGPTLAFKDFGARFLAQAGGWQGGIFAVFGGAVRPWENGPGGVSGTGGAGMAANARTAAPSRWAFTPAWPRTISACTSKASSHSTRSAAPRPAA